MESAAIWLAALLLVAAVVLPYAWRFRRRGRLDRARHEEAMALGIQRPPAQHPLIDELTCIGCGSCVEACPEGDVLGIVSGRAVIVNGMRCVGHGRCEEVCPVGAITVGLGVPGGRADLPVLGPHQETAVPGLYIAGELSGFALIRNAVQQGRRAVEHIAATSAGARNDALTEIIIVGAGPAGLSAALCAKQHGLSFLLLDQQPPGGTILQYPRKKLVLTQPVEIPLHGTLAVPEYTKEEMLALWSGILARFEIAPRVPEKVIAIERLPDRFAVRSEHTLFEGRHVVLALGRRGTPRRLGVPGEERAKVNYQLKDAASYRGHDLLVVGGGDSAVEAAVALARQEGNRVTLSYRRPKLVRIRQANEKRLEPLLASGKVRVLWESEVEEIGETTVRVRSPRGVLEVPNDFVFILAGGEPPFELLRRAGVTFAA